MLMISFSWYKNNHILVLFLFFCNHSGYAEKNILSLESTKEDNYSLKHAFLNHLASLSHAKNFVETGTYEGNSTSTAAAIFEHVYSIELSPQYHAHAMQRFINQNNVHLYLGDSAKMLPVLLNEIEGKTILFLDGHYSGGSTACGNVETPILEELIAIKNSTLDKPIILIDDIRFFTRFIPSDYPSLAYIEELIKRIDPQYHLYIIGDMALAFHEDEPFTVSPVIQACTISRMADEYRYTNENIEQQLYEIEAIIGHAQGNEKAAILELIPKFVQTNTNILGHHYRSWAGLIELYNQNYLSAIIHFDALQTLGYSNSRIETYWTYALDHYRNYRSTRAFLTR